MKLIKKILSSLFTILICLGVSASIGAFLDFYFNSYPIFVFIFLILGAIPVYLINRGRSYGSANKSSSNTCSLCEGQGRVRSTGNWIEWFFTLESPCPTCNGTGYSNTTPKTEDKNKFKPIRSEGGFDSIMYFFGLMVVFFFANVSKINKTSKYNEEDNPLFRKKLDFNLPQLALPNKQIAMDGKKELYDFCEKEGFNTTDKGIKECGLLINKRLLEASINPKEIDTSQGTEEILNKLEEQGKIIKKMEQREKVRRAINVYKAYKNSGLF